VVRADAAAVNTIANGSQRVVSSPHESRSIHVDLPAHYGFDAFQPADLHRRQEQQAFWRIETSFNEPADRDA
jgi:hypothetical protein